MQNMTIYCLRSGIDTALSYGRMDSDTALKFFSDLMLKLGSGYLDYCLDEELPAEHRSKTGPLDVLGAMIFYADEFVAQYPEDFLEYKHIRKFGTTPAWIPKGPGRGLGE